MTDSDRISAGLEPLELSVGDVLVEEHGQGRLVVAEHDATSDQRAGCRGDGEQLEVSARVREGDRAAKLSVSGRRRLVCKWEAGPRFPQGGRVHVEVTVRASIGHSAALSGTGSSARASCKLEANLLGEKRQLAMALPPGGVVDEGADVSRFTSAKQRKLTAYRSEVLCGDALRTKPLVATSKASVRAALTAGGTSAEVDLALTTAWEFRVSVRTAAE